MGKWIGAVCFIAFWIAAAIGASKFVRTYNEQYRATQAAASAHRDDVRMCRMQLGFDYDFHQRQLMMACAHEVTRQVAPVGHSRSIAFAAAWDRCMPEMVTCERALRP